MAFLGTYVAQFQCDKCLQRIVIAEKDTKSAALASAKRFGWKTTGHCWYCPKCTPTTGEQP